VIGAAAGALIALAPMLWAWGQETLFRESSH
jgi:hypothetical protein